jgi:hypothetical protein
MRRAWITLVMLAVFGVGGGIAVYLTGSRLLASDREAILTWERSAAEIVGEQLDYLGRAPDDVRLLPDAEARARLTDAERSFESATAALASLDTPSVTERTRDEIRAFLERAAAAISQVLTASEPSVASFEASLGEARVLYERARDTLIRLRCRARIPSCEATLLGEPTVS